MEKLFNNKAKMLCHCFLFENLNMLNNAVEMSKNS
jgi:hypothetical protein